MSGKKKPAVKKTVQEIREMIDLLEIAQEFWMDADKMDLPASAKEHYASLVARINKLIGEPK